jgi:hypothetical protein
VIVFRRGGVIGRRQGSFLAPRVIVHYPFILVWPGGTGAPSLFLGAFPFILDDGSDSGSRMRVFGARRSKDLYFFLEVGTKKHTLFFFRRDFCFVSFFNSGYTPSLENSTFAIHRRLTCFLLSPHSRVIPCTRSIPTYLPTTTYCPLHFFFTVL